MSYSNLSKTIALSLGVLAMTFLIGYFVFAAWQEPRQAPPKDNMPAPLNTGANAQLKEGGLILNTGGAAYGLIVQKGAVGIGTTKPEANLHVFGGTDGDFRLEGTNKARFLAYRGGDLWIQSGSDWVSGSTAPIKFSGIYGTPVHMTILGNGNVGIGTTEPTQKLDVAGYVKGQSGLCIGNDCRSSWPAAGTGGVTPALEIVLNDGPNITNYKCQTVYLKDICGDKDGCRVRIMIQHKTAYDDQFRMIDENIGMEIPGENGDRYPGISGYTRGGGGGEYFWISGFSRDEVFGPWDWVRMLTYNHTKCDTEPDNKILEEYYFRLMVEPTKRARFLFYD